MTDIHGVGQRIRKLRTERGWPQEQLASEQTRRDCQERCRDAEQRFLEPTPHPVSARRGTRSNRFALVAGVGVNRGRSETESRPLRLQRG